MTRAERRYRNEKRIRRRLRVVSAQAPGLLAWRPRHVYAKRRPLGCWRPRCGLCHVPAQEVRRRRVREVYRQTGVDPRRA